MSGAAITLDGGNVIGDLGSVRLGVGIMSAATVLFVHPGNDAQRAARAEMKAL